uniref:Asteroid domain-containing protein n=3 Tax=Clastoptera arizonana TaxID=38151 RepID=A0A1B6DTK4_9HEMI
MGVRGLKTFIDSNQEKFLQDYKLHNCYIVIDGDNIAVKILFSENHDSENFGGSYYEYAKNIRKFFETLRKCNVNPIIVFDGGYESKKLQTICNRKDSRILSSNIKDIVRKSYDGNLFPTYSSSSANLKINYNSENYPFFTKQIFREIIEELKIPFVQSDFEADSETAAIAKKYNCAVLSDDSDFYIFDIPFIPYQHLSMVPVTINKTNRDEQDKYYLKCKIYKIDHILQNYCGLNRSMLPLLAIVLGNDYIDSAVFRPLFFKLAQLYSLSRSEKLYNINNLLKWLSRKKTSQEALNEIFSICCDRSQITQMMPKANWVIEGYNIKDDSILENYLNIRNKNEVKYQAALLHPISNCNFDLMRNHNLVGNASKLYMDIIGHLRGRQILKVPDWLLQSSRRGEIDSSIFDLFTFGIYFFPIQSENYQKRPSFVLSLPIWEVVIDYLLGTQQSVLYFGRNNEQLVSFRYVSKEMKFKTLSKVEIILKVLGLSIDFKLFPINWQIPILSIIYWLKKMCNPNSNHLHTIVMCIVTLQAISSDQNIKYFNLNEKDRKVMDKRFLEIENEKQNKNGNFCDTVHSFAEFQNCLHHIMLLNSVLEFPLNQCCVSKFYSEKFVYNVFSMLDEKNLNIHVNLFKDYPSLVTIYKDTVQKCISMLPDIFSEKPQRRANSMNMTPENLLSRLSLRNEFNY